MLMLHRRASIFGHRLAQLQIRLPQVTQKYMLSWLCALLEFINCDFRIKTCVMWQCASCYERNAFNCIDIKRSENACFNEVIIISVFTI